MQHTVTLKGQVFELAGEIIKKGSILSFKAVDQDNKEFNLDESIKGTKVISIFPDINTSVCDLQTQHIAQLAKEKPHIRFISVTMDSPEIISKWCLSHGIDNIKIVSDAKFKEFASKTNLYIPQIGKLARGLIVLDDSNKIQDISINEEIVTNPHWDLIEGI